MPRTEALLAEIFPSVGGLHALADDGPRALRDSRLGRPALLRAGRRTVLVHAPVGTSASARAPRRRGRRRCWRPAPRCWPATASCSSARRARGRGTAAGDAARAGLPEGLLRSSDDLDGLRPGRRDRRAGAEGRRRSCSTARRWTAPSRARCGPPSRGRPGPGVGRARGRRPVRADALLDGLEAAARRAARRRPADAGHRDRPAALRPPRRPRSTVSCRRPWRRGAVAALRRPAGDRRRRLFAPVVLRSVPPDARVLREPVPGPVLAVVEAGARRRDRPRRRVRGRRLGLDRRPRPRRADRPLAARRAAWVNEHGFASPAPGAPGAAHRHAPARLPAAAAAQRALAALRPGAGARLDRRGPLVHGRESERFARAWAGPAGPTAADARRLAPRGQRDGDR